MVLPLRPVYDFGRSPHGFCHGWQNGSPGTLKSCSRVGVGSVPVFSRPGAGKTQLFPFGIKDSANSGFRSLKFFFRSIAFFNPLIFIVLQGGLENMKEKDVFGAFAGRSLFPFPFLPLSRFSVSLCFSFSLRFLYIVLLGLAPPLR